MRSTVLMFFLLVASVAAKAQLPTITLESLLRELVNRDKLTEYPSQPYRSLQASSYNRQSVSPDQPGWFADSDGVSCIRTEQNGDQTEWVLMEDFGPGAITKIWAVCFYYGMDNTLGANIKIYLDGNKEPVINTNLFRLVKGHDFVKPPLAAETKRAGNLYLPIPYAKSCKVTMDQKAFYNLINYQSYPAGTAVKTFTLSDYRQAQPLIDSVNQVLEKGVYTTPTGSAAASQTTRLLAPGKSVQVKLPAGNKAVTKLAIRITSEAQAQALRSTVLKASFDEEACIWSPVGDFFCNGVGLKPYLMWERAVQTDGTMICRWVMPYQQSGVIELENLGKEAVEVDLIVETAPRKWTPHSMHFHSNWRMDAPTPGFPLFDYNLIEVKGKGVYVGDQFTVLNPAEGWWGEGDEKVYVDSDTFPSHFGTGTEDYYGWAGGVVPNPVDEFDEPFLSNVRVAAPNSMGYNTCTRTRVLDAVPFNERLKFDIESSGSMRYSWFHLQYAVNTYWYACPGAQSNRKPLPDMAASRIMTLDELQDYNNKAKADKYMVPGAIEAENMTTYTTSAGVTEKEGMQVWGEMSNGAVKAFACSEPGQWVAVRLTELFDSVPLKACFIIHNEGGTFDLFVNGKQVRTVNMQSEHSSVSVLDLGVHLPVDNSLEIRLVYKGNTPSVVGIDYFTTQ